MFPDYITEAVQKLRRFYKCKRSLVISNYPIIEIIKITQNEEVSLKLFYRYSDGVLELQPPDRQYHSKISHYDFNKTERRWARKKEILFSFIADLKRCGLWELVANKDLFVINSFNDKINERKITQILDEVMNKEYKKL